MYVVVRFLRIFVLVLGIRGNELWGVWGATGPPTLSIYSKYKYTQGRLLGRLTFTKDLL